MKNLLLLLLIVPAIAFSQAGLSAKVVTTEEEYNYLTHGYKLQQETGGDMKAGYELKKIVDLPYEDYLITYYYFNHLESKKTRAMLIVLKKEKGSSDKIRYLCLPLNNTELFKKFLSDVQVLGVTMGSIFEVSAFAMLVKYVDLRKNGPEAAEK